MGNQAPYVSSTQVASSLPFDNSTGKGYSSTDVQGALEELRDHTVYDSATTATTASGTLTLTSSSKNVQFLTGTAASYTVQLPDATTIPLSSYYQIINTSSQTVNIDDGSGSTLISLSQNSIGYFTLQTNGTSAGVWVYWQVITNTATGIVSYNLSTTTTFTTSSTSDVVITGFTVTPVAGTYAIWYNASSLQATNGANQNCTIYLGGSAITDSIRNQRGGASGITMIMTTMTIAQFNGSQACDVRVNTNTGSITVGSRSLLLIRLGA